jgi:peptide/nickel transport system ATP-binding protein
MNEPLLRVEGLSVEFRGHEGVIHAVRNASFRIPKGRTVALVGESGSGKSVVSQAIMRILPGPGRITSGRRACRHRRARAAVAEDA